MCADYKGCLLDTSQERAAYDTPVLLKTEMDRSPFLQFQKWYQIARETKQIEEVNAMCVSTCSKDGRPSSRMVLMKKFSEDGVVFFSNTESRKGTDLAENSNAAVLFYWAPLKRQVRIEGRAEMSTDKEADEYWQSRPVMSRLTAVISQQSRPVASREELERRRNEAEGREGEIRRPSHWRGYVVVPDCFEFWQGHSDRLHDRFEYKRVAGGDWSLTRLQP